MENKKVVIFLGLALALTVEAVVLGHLAAQGQPVNPGVSGKAPYFVQQPIATSGGGTVVGVPYTGGHGTNPEFWLMIITASVAGILIAYTRDRVESEASESKRIMNYC